MTNKLEKALSQSTWFHATTFDQWKSICQLGIKADYNKSTSDSLDFGYGFYLAHSEEMALSFIQGYIKNHIRENTEPLILEFEFSPLKYLDEFKFCHFLKYDDEFSNFVFNNRIHNKFGSTQHHYDLIYGCMTDSVPTKIINEFKDGIISKTEALNELKKPSSRRQMVIHNQQICDELSLKRATKIILDKEFKEINKEEIDVTQYLAKKRTSD